MVIAALTTGTTSSGRSALRHCTPIAAKTGSTAWPIGNCQGLPSPKSPRMLISMRKGKRPPFTSDSMLMQLPTPLDCIMGQGARRRDQRRP